MPAGAPGTAAPPVAAVGEPIRLFQNSLLAALLSLAAGRRKSCDDSTSPRSCGRNPTGKIGEQLLDDEKRNSTAEQRRS